METHNMLISLAEVLETHLMGLDAPNDHDTVITALNPIAAEMHFTLEANDGTVRDFTISENITSIMRNNKR